MIQLQEDTTSKRLLGDTLHFCPVALKDRHILWPGTDDLASKYREKTYYFSSTKARERFLLHPQEFVAKTGPLKVGNHVRTRMEGKRNEGREKGKHLEKFRNKERKDRQRVQLLFLFFLYPQPPALRVLMLGTRGSGKTTHGSWLAQQLGVFHIQFRERLQELILAKTQSRVVRNDEVEPPEEKPPEDLEVLMKESGGRGETKEAEVSLHRTRLCRITHPHLL